MGSCSYEPLTFGSFFVGTFEDAGRGAFLYLKFGMR